MIAWIVTTVTMVGTVANSFKKRWCFIIWLFTNTYWVIHNLTIKEYPQAVIYALNVVTCVIGLVAWKKKAQKKAREEK